MFVSLETQPIDFYRQLSTKATQDCGRSILSFLERIFGRARASTNNVHAARERFIEEKKLIETKYRRYVSTERYSQDRATIVIPCRSREAELKTENYCLPSIGGQR